jgi:hypothetical protein
MAELSARAHTAKPTMYNLFFIEILLALQGLFEIGRAGFSLEDLALTA